MILLSIDPGSHVSGAALWQNGKLIAAAAIKNSVVGAGPRECAIVAQKIVDWARPPQRRVAPCTMCGGGMGGDLDLNGKPYTHGCDRCGNKIVDADRIHKIAVEWPQIYARGENKTVGDPNNNLPLVAVIGAVAALFPQVPVFAYQPHSWKGGIGKPKKVSEPYAIEGKVRARLSADELKALEMVWPKNVRHSWDLVDAVGVGLHHLKRFERIRVFARE